MRSAYKRLFRLYRAERFMVHRRGGRKRALGTRAPLAVPQWPNDSWSLDFVADQFIDGRRLRILVVVDDCTRECLALVADTSISGIRVARELDRLLAERGKPKTIVSDNGTELTSNAVLQSARFRPAHRRQVPACRTGIWRLLLSEGHAGADQDRPGSWRAASHRRDGHGR